MTLNFERPNEVLTAELDEVSKDAAGLITYLDNINISLPDEFPVKRLEEIATFLVELPDCTARGCREPLLFAQQKLAEIRGIYVERDEKVQSSVDDETPPRPLRGEALDKALTTLLTSVSTALQIANQQYSLEMEIGLPEPAVLLPNNEPANRISLTVRDSEKGLAAQRKELDDIRVLESQNADRLRRRFTDVLLLNRLARAELGQPRIVPAWLKRIGTALRDYPKLITKAASAIKVSADIADWAHDKWSKFNDEVFRAGTNLIRDVSNDISQFAVDLEEYQRKQLAAMKPAEEKYSFDIASDELRKIIIAGNPIPEAWRSRIRYLDLSHERELTDLSSLRSLTLLEELLISRTNVYDISPISGMKFLTRLELSRSMVSDIQPISSLTNLKRLDLDGLTIRSIEPLRRLEKLEELDASRTQISSLDPVRNMRNLRRLDVSRTNVSNLVPISDLRNLTYLDISHTKVTDLFTLGGMQSLEELHIQGTDIPEIEIRTVLQFLRNLNNFTPP